jgi:hypothetical protein
VRTIAAFALCAVAIVAKDSKAGWKSSFPQPCIEGIPPGTATRLARALAVDVIERQELLLALPAAVTVQIVLAVVGQRF